MGQVVQVETLVAPVEELDVPATQAAAGVRFRFKGSFRLGGLSCEEYNFGGAGASDLVYSHLDM